MRVIHSKIFSAQNIINKFGSSESKGERVKKILDNNWAKRGDTEDSFLEAHSPETDRQEAVKAVRSGEVEGYKYENGKTVAKRRIQ